MNIDEREQGTPQPQTDTSEVNYIEALAEMKKNTVSREEYNKLMAENKQLVDAMVNGESIQMPTPEPEVNLDELRNDLFTKENTNLAFAEKALELREELLKRGEKDPFVPHGHNYVPTDNDIESAEKAADALRHCVDVANGDPNVFQNELQRIMVDSVPSVLKNKVRR